MASELPASIGGPQQVTSRGQWSFPQAKGQDVFLKDYREEGSTLTCSDPDPTLIRPYVNTDLIRPC